MEATLDSLALGFSVALRPDVLLYAFIGCLVGTLVGMLPGIGPLAGISILLPVTFGLDATKAVVMLAGIYYGSQYGGSTTSILMRIPGEAASVMTCIDGYAMAQKGRAGAALCIAAVGSFIAGTFGVIVLTVVAPPLASFALRFGPPEYTALLVLGLIFLAYMSSTSLMRTLLMACVGLLLGCIGIDVMSGHFRYSFDIKELGDGIGIVPVAVGLFGLGEILSTPSKTVTRQGRPAAPAPSCCRAATEWRQSAMPIARGSVLGFLVGIVPGSAHIISSFLSYALEKRISKTPEEFGKGAVAGVAGPGVGQQRGLHRRLRADAGAGPADRAGDGRADGGAADPRRAAGAAARHRAPAGVLGLHRLDVRRQPDAAGAQPAAGRPVRERAAHPLRLPLSAHHHVLHHRRLRGEPLHRRRVDHADHGRGRLSACASSTSIRRRWCSASSSRRPSSSACASRWSCRAATG